MKAEQKPGDYSLFRVDVPNAGMHTFSVSQTCSRLFPKGDAYEYSTSCMTLLKAQGENFEDGLTFIKTVGHGYGRDAYLECENLEAGSYYFAVRMSWKKKNKGHNFVATCYGPGEVKFVAEEGSTIPMATYVEQVFLAQIAEGKATETNYEAKNAPAIKKYSGNVNGFDVKYYVNEEKEAKLEESISYSGCKLEFLGEFKDCTNKYTALVAPGEKKIVIMKIDGGYSYSTSTHVEHGEAQMIEECMSKGKATERAPGINWYFWWHGKGIMSMYKNDSADKTLDETMEWTLSGLAIPDFPDNKTVVSLGPGQCKIININATGGAMSVSYSWSKSIS